MPTSPVLLGGPVFFIPIATSLNHQLQELLSPFLSLYMPCPPPEILFPCAYLPNSHLAFETQKNK